MKHFYIRLLASFITKELALHLSHHLQNQHQSSYRGQRNKLCPILRRWNGRHHRCSITLLYINSNLLNEELSVPWLGSLFTAPMNVHWIPKHQGSRPREGKNESWWLRWNIGRWWWRNYIEMHSFWNQKLCIKLSSQVLKFSIKSC